MGYEEIEHTADWQIRVRHEELAGLFESATRSMLHLAGAQPASRDLQRREVEILAPDLASLLVEWLQEWIYLLETEDRIPVEFLQITLAETSLTATVIDAPLQSLTKQIKAVTYHGLQLIKTENGYLAQVVFDV
jgi:SHS2 domain-containing protein